MSLPNTAYGSTVSSTTDGVLDYYLVGGAVTFSFPTGTSLGTVYVYIAIQTNLNIFKSAMRDFTTAAYDAFSQQQLTNLYLAAQAAGLANREAYLVQIFTWVNAVAAYAASYKAAVSALIDPVAIAAMVFDSTQFVADPKITAIAAMQIPD